LNTSALRRWLVIFGRVDSGTGKAAVTNGFKDTGKPLAKATRGFLTDGSRTVSTGV